MTTKPLPYVPQTLDTESTWHPNMPTYLDTSVTKTGMKVWTTIGTMSSKELTKYSTLGSSECIEINSAKTVLASTGREHTFTRATSIGYTRKVEMRAK